MKNVYQFRISEELSQVLDQLQGDLNANNKAEIIREAITYFTFMVDEIKSGKDIYIIDKQESNSIKKGIKVVFPVSLTAKLNKLKPQAT